MNTNHEWARRPFSGTNGRAMALLAALFILSRLAFYTAGVRFDLRPLDTSWHILDPVWLREELLQSVFYMPGQPPLYNLMLGALLKATRDEERLAALFHCVYSGMALATCLLLFRLMRQLAVARWLAIVGSGLFMMSPALVLYENIPYYSVPVLLLLTASVSLFLRAQLACSFRNFSWLFLTMAALIYTRSMFQVFWFLALLGLCLLARPTVWRTILGAALTPLLLILALYGKNALVTGHFSTSSWLGMSVVKLSVHALPPPLRRELVAQGVLSTLAYRDTTYDPPEALADYFARAPHTGIPVLDQSHKSTGHANYNHLAYVAYSSDCLRDSLYVMAHYPASYLRSVGSAWLMFLRPASDYPYLRPNRDAIEPWSRAYARLIAGQPVYPKEPMFALAPGTIGYGVLLGYLLTVGFGIVTMLQQRPARASTADLVVSFMCLNLLYVSVVGNSFEIGENQRFHFATHPLLIASLALLATRICKAYHSRSVRLSP